MLFIRCELRKLLESPYSYGFLTQKCVNGYNPHITFSVTYKSVKYLQSPYCLEYNIKTSKMLQSPYYVECNIKTSKMLHIPYYVE